MPDVGFHVKQSADIYIEGRLCSWDDDCISPIYITSMPSLDFSVDIGEYKLINLSLNCESCETYTLETNRSSKLISGLGRSGLDQRIRFKSGTKICFLLTPQFCILGPLPRACSLQRSHQWIILPKVFLRCLPCACSCLDAFHSKGQKRQNFMLFHAWGHWPSHPMSL